MSRGEQLGPDDERLLADLARQAGPPTHAVALRRALDASRAGLVTAPTAAELAGLLSRLPENRPSPVTPGQRQMPHGKAHRGA